MYVKVYGSIRVFKEKIAIVGNHITEVKKHDEITNHLLQIFVSHNIRVKGTLAAGDLKGGSVGGNNKADAARKQGAVDQTQIVFDLMKEVTKSSRFAHKSDLWTIC